MRINSKPIAYRDMTKKSKKKKRQMNKQKKVYLEETKKVKQEYKNELKLKFPNVKWDVKFSHLFWSWISHVNKNQTLSNRFQRAIIVGNRERIAKARQKLVEYHEDIEEFLIYAYGILPNYKF